MTRSLQMIRAEVDLRGFQRWMGMRDLVDPDYGMHCLLVESFGELAPKPFRVLAPQGTSQGCLYGYSQAGAEELQDAAATFACPLQAAVISADYIESKAMPARWGTGKRLGFEVRIRPTRRLKRRYSDGRQRVAERDAFLMQALDESRPTRSREDVYRDWLAERLKGSGGAELETARMQSFRRTRTIRRRSARQIEGPDVLMRGDVAVIDSEAFTRLLARGVGRHRAFGYGMLLLRPVSRSV